MAAAFGVAGLVSTQAHATLIISANGTSMGSDSTNMATSFTGSVGGFNINIVSAIGQAAFGSNGELLDVSSLDVSSGGSGTLKLLITETGVTASALANFAASFTGNITGANVTRSIYLDTTNSGLESTLIGSTTLASQAFSLSNVSLSGPFSLVEEIDITAFNAGATLSSDDNVTVPEPMSLALVGAGLLGLGLIRRRK
ncbi:MAG TPA: PEP-CTERM sorting domain-containing protein [Aliidongia sp.]|nr:PEP-CTERM sorting domain-containing protein [Aliidongia sp.]